MGGAFHLTADRDQPWPSRCTGHEAAVGREIFLCHHAPGEPLLEALAAVGLLFGPARKTAVIIGIALLLAYAAAIAVNLSGSDPDGTVSSFTIDSAPLNGVLKDGSGNVLTVGSSVTATGNGAVVYFTPNANWNGDTSFQYASKDNSSATDGTPATASIKVTSVDDAPDTANTVAAYASGIVWPPVPSAARGKRPVNTRFGQGITSNRLISGQNSAAVTVA